MGGPWFTVQTGDQGWHEIAKPWLSDGAQDGPGRLELRLAFERWSDGS